MLKFPRAQADQGAHVRFPTPPYAGLKLGLAFAAVLAVMLGSLGLVLVKADHAAKGYERAIGWRAAVAGASNQAAGTRQQQASQALYVATGDPRYKQEWQQGVEKAEK